MILFVVVLLLNITLVSAEDTITWNDYLNDTDIAILKLNVSCGDNFCSVGENIYNCPDDCALEPVSLSVDFFDPRIPLNTKRNQSVNVANKLDQAQKIVLFADDELSDYLIFPNNTIILKPFEHARVSYTIKLPKELGTDKLQGHIVLIAGGKQLKVPLTLLITSEKDKIIDMNVKVLSKEVRTEGMLRIYNRLYAYELDPLNLTLTYDIRMEGKISDPEFSFNESRLVQGAKDFMIEMPINKTKLKEGAYVLTLSTTTKGIYFSDSDSFVIANPFWTPQKVKLAVILSGLIFFGFIAYIIYRKYSAWKLSKMRYLLPDFNLIPKKTEKSLWLGKIPESTKKAYLDPNALTTHVLVTGSTGSGKSVTASVIIEEVLNLKLPVLVFDPTSQWTGFVKQLKDKNLFKYYSEFGMKPEEAKSFRGLLYDVETPDINIDIHKYMNPGEVTVFNLSKLKTGEYDQAVMRIIDDLFHIPWEESPDLRMVLVFDECHRLLEKYGGKGGYVALEKAAREFRKWGIGLVMVSQVSADFKEAVAGNILTEVQLNTKSIEDIQKIEQKYGREYSTRITRQSIGVAMVQNPHYNDGKPWFVHFRPTLHDPHKIPDEELKKYAEYSSKLDDLESKLTSAKSRKAQDMMMELKLARDKLKEGHFKMVDIYLKALLDKMKDL